MNVSWSSEALAALGEILLMVEDYAGSTSADRYFFEFNRLVALAAENPNMGKLGVIPDTRELYPLNGKYRIVYEFSGDTLNVLTVKSSRQLHTAENFARH